MKTAVPMAVLAAVVLTAGSWALTAPRPAAIPQSWELEFTYHPLRSQTLIVGGKKVTYWYFRYMVINRTEDDQVFVPDFTLYTDTGQTLLAGQGVPDEVFDKIKSDVEQEPLLKTQTSIIGPLLRGKDNAKEGLAIFTDFDAAASHFDVFIGGLSGETQTIKLPTPIKAMVKGKQGLTDTARVAKTLQLYYQVTGDPAHRSTEDIKLLSETWVMR